MIFIKKPYPNRIGGEVLYLFPYLSPFPFNLSPS
jgi:hypothetical protein